MLEEPIQQQIQVIRICSNVFIAKNNFRWYGYYLDVLRFRDTWDLWTKLWTKCGFALLFLVGPQYRKKQCMYEMRYFFLCTFFFFFLVQNSLLHELDEVVVLLFVISYYLLCLLYCLAYAYIVRHLMYRMIKKITSEHQTET